MRRRPVRPGLLTALALCSVLWGRPSSAAVGNTGELVLRLAQVVAVGGFAVYDGVATAKQESSSIVLFVQGGVLAPLAIENGIRGVTGDVRPDADAFWLLTDGLMNQQLLFGPSGALAPSTRLPELYALTWAGGMNMSGTLLARALS